MVGGGGLGGGGGEGARLRAQYKLKLIRTHTHTHMITPHPSTMWTRKKQLILIRSLHKIFLIFFPISLQTAELQSLLCLICLLLLIFGEKKDKNLNNPYRLGSCEWLVCLGKTLLFHLIKDLAPFPGFHV